MSLAASAMDKMEKQRWTRSSLWMCSCLFKLNCTTEWKLYNGHLWKTFVYLLHLLNGVDLTNFCSFMAHEKDRSSCVLYYPNMLTFSQRSDAWRLCFFKTQTPYNPGWVFTDSYEPHLPHYTVAASKRTPLWSEGNSFDSLHIDKYTVKRAALTEHQNE